MRIQGLQKLTLLDYPEKMAATVFIGGCNFRCPFCHNASLVTKINEKDEISVEVVLDYLKKRRSVLEGVCITGGEPLIQPGLEEFIREIKALGYLVKLDTNGSSLEKLQNLVEKNLIDYVAMDIKNTPEKYGETIGVSDERIVPEVLKVVDYLKANHVPYEFRTTLVREFHRRDDVIAMAEWLQGESRYYLQGFVDSGDVICDGLRGYSEDIMEQALELVKEYLPNVKLRG
jgi:pyruvate formate lyase activating enzyme